MKHLSPDERLRLVEAPTAVPHPHLDRCDVCRREVEGLRAVLEETRSTPVPEPSPLFWDHFAARVAERVRREDVAPRAPGWSVWRLLVPVGVGAAALVAALAVFTLRPLPGAGPVRPAASASSLGAPSGAEGDDEIWAAVTSLADDVGFEGVSESGVAPSSGAIDGAVWRLSDRERAEFGRLLRAELDRAPAGS